MVRQRNGLKCRSAYPTRRNKDVMNLYDMEIAIANYFNPRINLCVPNVSWGFNIHECDLLVLTKNQYLIEVEIKLSKSDLKADLKKRHKHINRKIKHLYFALPEELEPHIEYVPERAGIFIVRPGKTQDKVHKIRYPKTNLEALPITDRQAFQFARLGALRIWGMKREINNMIRREKLRRSDPQK